MDKKSGKMKTRQSGHEVYFKKLTLATSDAVNTLTSALVFVKCFVTF